MAKSRMSRAGRLRKRRFGEAIKLRNEAVRAHNLSSPKPKAAKVVVRAHDGSLRVVADRDCSLARLGSMSARFNDPKGNSLSGSIAKPKAPAPRWAGADKQAIPVRPRSAQPVIGSSTP